MRILFYNINFHPELVASGKYSGELAQWMHQRGHQVRVVTTPPYFPAWKVFHGYSAWRYRRETELGFPVWRCPVWVPKTPQAVTRLLHQMSFFLSSLPVVWWHTGWRPHVVFVNEPPLLGVPFAIVLARLTGGKCWLHVQDLELEEAYALGLLKGGWIRRFLYAVERWTHRHVDRVSTISEPMSDSICAKTGYEGQPCLFPNWVDPERIFPLQEPSDFRMGLGISAATIVVLYAGSMGKKYDLDVVLEVAHRLAQKTEILFVFCSEGPTADRLKQAHSGLLNIRWLPLQAESRLNHLLNLADIHLLPLRPYTGGYILPSKLLGMMASARPVVATLERESRIAGLVAQGGVVVEPGCSETLAETIGELSGKPEKRMQLGRSARNYALEHWSKERVLGDFEKSLIQAVEST